VPLEPDAKALEGLASEARQQGYRFMDRLIQDARTNKNRFTGDGERFLGVFLDGKLVGCGGINRDPFTTEPVGRLRRLFVSSSCRRNGVATRLVRELLRQSAAHFPTVRLRAADNGASDFFLRLGFSRINDDQATHSIKIQSQFAGI